MLRHFKFPSLFVGAVLQQQQQQQQHRQLFFFGGGGAENAGMFRSVLIDNSGGNYFRKVVEKSFRNDRKTDFFLNET